MTKSRTRYPSPSSSSSLSSSSKLGIGTSSNLMPKLKPKIRIIHLYAPEIIKTDAANFRELVQRLTGKPEHDEQQDKGGSRRRKQKTTPSNKLLLDPIEEQEQEFMVGLQNGLRLKKEGENDHLLEGFSEFDCFMEDFSTMPVV